MYPRPFYPPVRTPLLIELLSWLLLNWCFIRAPARWVREQISSENNNALACRTRMDQDQEYGSVLLFFKADRTDDDHCEATYYEDLQQIPPYCGEEVSVVGIEIPTATRNDVEYFCNMGLRRLTNSQSCCSQFNDPEATDCNKYRAWSTSGHNYRISHGSCPITDFQCLIDYQELPWLSSYHLSTPVTWRSTHHLAKLDLTTHRCSKHSTRIL